MPGNKPFNKINKIILIICTYLLAKMYQVFNINLYYTHILILLLVQKKLSKNCIRLSLNRKFHTVVPTLKVIIFQ